MSDITINVCSGSSSLCECRCPTGPCEHKWDGEPYHSDSMSSVTCSRCGMLAISHDLRTSD